jgi:transposase
MILLLKPKYLSYKIDGIFAEHNHNILQLPLYHSELNQNELIWATVKNWVAQNNTTFKMDVIKLAGQKLASITAEEWQYRRQYVRNIEQQLMA